MGDVKVTAVNSRLRQTQCDLSRGDVLADASSTNIICATCQWLEIISDEKNCCKGDWTNRSTLFVFYWYLTLWSLALTTSSHSRSMGPDAWKRLPLELRWHSVKSTFKRHWNPSCSLEPTASLLTFLMTRLLFTLTNFVFIFILSPIFLIADKHWYPTQGAIKIALTDLSNI